MNLHLDQIQGRLISKMKSGQLVRVVYFGSSNTQRIILGMHWGDWLELACKRTYGQYPPNMFQAIRDSHLFFSREAEDPIQVE